MKVQVQMTCVRLSLRSFKHFSVSMMEIHLNAAHSEKRDDAVPRDGLQETWRSGQTLESCSAGGKEGAKHNDPWRRPGQSPDHQVTIDSFTKPVERGEDKTFQYSAVVTHTLIKKVILISCIFPVYIIRLTCPSGLLLLYRHQTAPHMTCLGEKLLKKCFFWLFNSHESALSDPHRFCFIDFGLVKDTHSRCGADGCNRADGDRLLSIAQVSGAVGARHDTCEWSQMK